MTIGEAIDVNILLEALVKPAGNCDVTLAEIERAGVALADRAHAILFAGYDGKTFSAAVRRARQPKRNKAGAA